MKETQRKVLFTGATGKIGSYVCTHLHGSYHILSGARREVDNLPNPVHCDIRNFDSVLKAVQGVDTVVHLAGQSWEYDVHEKMIPDNIAGCYNVFEASRKAGVRRVVFASTNHVVGLYLEEGRAVDETVAVRPDLFYAVTKVFGEALARLYAERHGMEIICARIGWCSRKERVARLLNRLHQKDRNVLRGIWISYEDMTRFIKACLDVDKIDFEILNCISANTNALMDLTKAREVIGYAPQDDIERLEAGGEGRTRPEA